MITYPFLIEILLRHAKVRQKAGFLVFQAERVVPFSLSSVPLSTSKGGFHGTLGNPPPPKSASVYSLVLSLLLLHTLNTRKLSY